MIYVLATGPLVANPVKRTGQSGKPFTTASIRSGSGDEVIFVNVIAFGEAGERLAELRRGNAVSASGRGELRSWTSKDGSERTSLAIAASEITAARPRRMTQDARDDAPRSTTPRNAYAHRRRAAEPAGDLRPFNDDLSDLYSRGEP